VPSLPSRTSSPQGAALDPDLGFGADLPEVLAAFGEEAAAEFDALEVDEDADDAQIAEYVARANAPAPSGREHLSALSALSQQMSAYRPLSPEEQNEQLQAFHQGLKARQKLESGRLSGRARRAAEDAVRAGEQAQTALVASMFRLTLIIAREHATERYGRERALDLLPDLVAEANLALVEKVAAFDPARCPTFSIYAGRIIRDRVRMSLHKTSAVGVAPSWLRLKRIYTVLRPEVEMRLGRTPTTEEMKDELRAVCMQWAAARLTEEQKQLPEAQRLELMESKLRKQGMLGAIDHLQEVLSATNQVASLDSPLGEGGSTLGDLLTDQGPSGDFDAVEHAELARDLMAALDTLTERERQIVLHRFGFVDGECWTYAKLAPRYQVSAERIRQIERNVLSKLRGPGFANLATHLPSHNGDPLPAPQDTATTRRRRPLRGPERR
jgi:RNA polymerase sigma factor (sigma-70 family)